MGPQSAQELDYGDLCLKANLESLRVPERSRSLVLDSKPRGEFVTLSDGNLALRVDGRILGAPADDLSRESSMEDVFATGDGLVVVFGLGVGNAAREIRQRVDNPILVYEPDPGILRKLLSVGPSDLGGITLVCDWSDFRASWDAGAYASRHGALIHSPGYESIFPEDSLTITDVVQRHASIVAIRDTTLRKSYKKWVNHFALNAPTLVGAVPFGGLKGQYKGVPAFIVGAGPSLDKNGALLAQAAKKGIVFVVDVAARAVARHGAKPQILTTIEARDCTKFISDLPWIDEVVRAFSVQANPSTWNCGKGPLLPFFEGTKAYKVLESLFGVPGIAVGGSVSTAAFSLAVAMECSPIVLIGQDLAYTGGRRYAQGTDLSSLQAKLVESAGKLVFDNNEAPVDYVAAKAWGGQGVVPSGFPWEGFRGWFEQSAETIRQHRPNWQFINSTEGGSHVLGFEDIPLSEVLSTMAERSITAESLAADAVKAMAPISEAAIRQWTEHQLRQLAPIRRAVRQLQSVATRADKALKAGNLERVASHFQRITAAEQQIRDSARLQPMIEGWVYESLAEITHRGANSSGEHCDALLEAQEGVQMDLALARAISSGAGEMESALQTLLARVASSDTR
jgi:hypothetical protein